MKQKWIQIEPKWIQYKMNPKWNKNESKMKPKAKTKNQKWNKNGPKINANESEIKWTRNETQNEIKMIPNWCWNAHQIGTKMKPKWHQTEPKWIQASAWQQSGTGDPKSAKSVCLLSETARDFCQQRALPDLGSPWGLSKIPCQNPTVVRNVRWMSHLTHGGKGKKECSSIRNV